MTQEKPQLSLSSYSVTVLGVSNIKPVYWFSLRYPPLFVSVTKGNQRFDTTTSSRAKSVQWNETFKFAGVTDDQSNEIRIDLYRKKGNGAQRHLGHIYEQLDSLQLETEIKRQFSCGATITFKISLTRKMKSKPDRVFALIIGINEYKSDKHMNLRGCVNDARAMGLFLSSLQVPETNVCTLTNRDATRESILSCFKKHLTKNPQIEKDDAIIFFYAGHGSRVEAPKEWETSDGMIETICPHDEGTGENGEEIPGIPSTTINTLLRELATEKGKNITAIFDSCHSGAIARVKTRSGEELEPRCTPNGCPIKDPDLDVDICGPGRYAKVAIPENFMYDSMSSHVLLAACKHEEPAYEATSTKGEACGAFTNALITTLYSAPLDRITYAEFIDYLPALPRQQTPQLGGINTNRVLFDAMVPPAEEYRNSFIVKRRTAPNSAAANGTAANGTAANGTAANGTAANGTAANGTAPNGTAPNGTATNGTATNGTAANGTAANGTAANGTATKGAATNNTERGQEYEVEAGLIHGISLGTEFYIQSTDYAGPVSSAYLGVLVAKTVNAQSSILIHRSDDLEFEVPLGARAIVSNWKNDASILKVFIHPDDRMLGGFFEPSKEEETEEEKLRKQCYAKVPRREDADVVLRYDSVRAILAIERTDKIVGAYANRVIEAKLPQHELTRLPFILDGIALFRYHLLRFAGDQHMQMDGDTGSSVVTDGIEDVKMHLYRLGLPSLGYRKPISESLFKDSNHAHLLSSEDARYGLKIENYRPQSFFPYLFYFDPSDYSIQQWLSPYGPKMNPPLHALQSDQPGSVTVGYGAGGGDPIQFISGDDPQDTGFIKLFVSSVYVDMGHIAQKPVIDAERKRKALKKADDNKMWGGSLAVVTVSQS